MVHKKVLFLGPEDSPLLAWIKNQGDEVIQSADKLSPEEVAQQNFDFLVSYGYRHIIRKEILDLFPDRAVNLHISYLPWNRGADPNLWSFIEDSPKGVTIHYVDEGLDTGDIIIQKRVDFDLDTETLATSYQKLHREIQQLFKEVWNDIKHLQCPRKKQIGDGSMHLAREKESLGNLLNAGWDTPVSELLEYGRKNT